MANDPLAFFPDSRTAPALELVSITPSDSVDLAKIVRDIRVGIPGDITVIDDKGNIVLFKDCLLGERLGPFRVARVKATGTTAASLVGYV